MYRQPTTGFFEQDHSAKSIAKRQKKKSIQAAKASQGSKSNVQTAALPKPVSSTTKAQLGAFAFQKPTKPDQEKQEGGHAENRTTDVPEHLQDRFSSPEKESCNRPPSKDCPQTPVPRLALKDLIGFGEDGHQPLFNMATDVSPEERIVWQVSPRGTPSAITPASKRQKRTKRARSSSPIAGTPLSKRISPQIHPDPKTPHADPVNDVWQRYSSTDSGPRPRNPPGVPLRLFSAEKRDSLNLSPLGLRRAYSCGSEWPPMSAKRRKPGDTQRNSPEGEDEVGKMVEVGTNPILQPVPARRGEGKSKLSRVSMLLNKVHEKLSKSGTEDKSSSPPPPSLNSGVYDLPSSPTRTATSRRTNQSIAPPTEKSAACQNVSDGDEYDDGFDDEIDLETLDKVEEAVVAFTQKQQQFTQRNSRIEKQHVTIAQEGSDFDEFEFEDDNKALDDIDVDVLLSQQPGALSAKPVPPRTPKQQKPAVSNNRKIATQGVVDVVEEFGDIDFGNWDDEDFDCVI
ncbi:hypothetical protein L211DRAFT_695379 [Terfezia boudieri ATCC MYA-4762]|uniref:Uncharacterized protein n=1 Tax=Terfezia boudieri ATCC MYA-4762 TaxID=1051890 RepID=A0A3N4M851_9PEZI|nr:hypothetical protein L211DRAFT_695379 [Terfezia boudieri ATCC MYA-4762]